MPKRSAGCFECRKRKVRCDEAKPECNTCIRRNHRCPGYRPPQSFILHKFDQQAQRPELIREDESRYAYSDSTSSPTSSSSPGSQASPPTRAVARMRSSDQRSFFNTPLMKHVSTVAADRVQHLGTFISLYLPKCEGPALPPPSALMLALPTLPANSQVLLAAVDALSAAQIAVDYRDKPLIDRSRSLYGVALSQMVRTIDDPRLAKSDEALLSSYLLTLFEVFVGFDKGYSLFNHVQGLLGLLEQRGPASFKDRLSMQIFHAIRYSSLTICYHLRKASPLDQPRWMAVTAQAAKLDPYVALQDIAIRIPRLLERTDKYNSNGHSPAELDALLFASTATANAAFDWLATFENPEPLYDRVPLASMPGFLTICPDRVFDPVLDFHSFSAGICYMNYWTNMLILQSNTFKLLLAHRRPLPAELAAWDRQLADYADHICRSIPYNTRPGAGYTAKFGSLTPLVAARLYYVATGKTKEAAWCEKVYMSAKIPGLYQTAEPLMPLQAMKERVGTTGTVY